MDKRPKRKYSRRKRIQLDEDKEEQSPEKDQAASSSTGKILSRQTSSLELLKHMCFLNKLVSSFILSKTLIKISLN